MIMKWIQKGLLGLLIGLSTSYIILTISLLMKGNSTITGQELLHQIIIAGIMGIIIGFGSKIYDIDRLPFTVATVIHYAFVTCVVFVAGCFGKWFDISNLKTFTSVMVSQTISYVIIWCIVFILTKRDVEQFNDILLERRKSHEKHH